jgi:hypothetical protein
MTVIATLKPLEGWLTDPRRQVGLYYHKAQQLIRLNQLWKQHDAPLVRYSMIANWKDTTLVMAVDSSEWATHLHYAQYEVLERLKTFPGLELLTTVKWYVRVPTDAPKQTNPVPTVLTLSQPTQALLQSVSRTIVDPALQAALRRLAE